MGNGTGDARWGTTQRENRALLCRFLADVVVGGDIDAVGTFVTGDLVDHKIVFGDGDGNEVMSELGWSVLAAADVGSRWRTWWPPMNRWRDAR